MKVHDSTIAYDLCSGELVSKIQLVSVNINLLRGHE